MILRVIILISYQEDCATYVEFFASLSGQNLLFGEGKCRRFFVLFDLF